MTRSVSWATSTLWKAQKSISRKQQNDSGSIKGCSGSLASTRSHTHLKKQVIGSEWALCYQLTAEIAASASARSVYLICEARLSNKDRSGIQPRSSQGWCTLGWLDLTKVDNWTESLVRWASQTSGDSSHFHGSRLADLRLSLEVRLSKKQQSAQDWRVSGSCSCQSGAGVSSKPQVRLSHTAGLLGRLYVTVRVHLQVIVLQCAEISIAPFPVI